MMSGLNDQLLGLIFFPWQIDTMVSEVKDHVGGRVHCPAGTRVRDFQVDYVL